MERTKSGSCTCDRRRHQLHAHGQRSECRLHLVHCRAPLLRRGYQDFRVGRHWQDEIVELGAPERRDRRAMMRVLSVEESDDDACVDDDQRHSERSLLRYPRPYSPVRHPAKRSLAVVALVRKMRPVPSASTRILSPAASPARCKTATGRVVWFLELMRVTAGVRRGVSIFFRESFIDGIKTNLRVPRSALSGKA